MNNGMYIRYPPPPPAPPLQDPPPRHHQQREAVQDVQLGAHQHLRTKAAMEAVRTRPATAQEIPGADCHQDVL